MRVSLLEGDVFYGVWISQLGPCLQLKACFSEATPWAMRSEKVDGVGQFDLSIGLQVSLAIWTSGREPTLFLVLQGKPPPPPTPVTITPRQAQPLVPNGVPSVMTLPSFPDGKPVEVDPHHILIEDPDGSCALILDNLTGIDSGQYMCFAASAAGNASTLGKILVQGEPWEGGQGLCA